MLQLVARQFEATELALEVSERHTAAGGAALDLREEHPVRPAGGLLRHPALERGERIVEQRLAPFACRDRHAREFVAALLGKALRQVYLVSAEDVHAKALRERDG